MSHKSEWTDSERDQRDRAILFGYINGDSRKTLSMRHGITLNCLGKILRAQGVWPTKDQAKRDKQIMDLFQKGQSRKEIAEELDITYATVKCMLRRKGYSGSTQRSDCSICGRSFLQRRIHQHMCSDECRAENYRRFARIQREKDIGKWKKCKHCGHQYKVYGVAKSRQNFCSRSCAKSYEYRKKEIRNKEIVYYREIQNLTFRRIGEIFHISHSTARYNFLKQRLKINLERAERMP